MSPYHTQKIPNSQSVAGVFPLYKKAGETLAVLVERFRSEQGISKDTPVTYAGRLDPMAEGLMLLLVGEACKKKDEYLGCDKTYIFEVLFGVATDTFDMLGLITDTKEYSPTEGQIEGSLETIKKTKTFPYPPFSSKPVAGKPLFAHARAGTLPELLPSVHGEVKEVVLKTMRTTTFEEAIKEKRELLQKVEGDFRQKEIIEGWERFLENRKESTCVIATFEATVSSGVYIRTLATLLGGPALAYSIKRTRVGDFSL